MNDLINASKASVVIETLENYSINRDHTFSTESTKGNYGLNIYDDRAFWEDVLNSEDHKLNNKFNSYECIFSNWISRVPGLIFSEGSFATRKLAENFRLETPIHFGKDIHIYNPVGKSAHISGGIGCLNLPQDERGYLLGSITTSANISAGIPILIFPEVLRDLNLKEGDIITLNNIIWQRMSLQWASNFPSTIGVPRAYLIVEDKSQIEIQKRRTNLKVSPFSIMEYTSGNALLYDFVYCDINTNDIDCNNIVIDFFEKYKKQYENSNYLISINSTEATLVEGLYSSSLELAQKNGFGKTQLELIKERIKQSYFGSRTIERVLDLIPKYYANGGGQIERISTIIGLKGVFYRNASVAESAITLVEGALNQNKFENLISLLSNENPGILNS